jgi:hypothetical protein
LTLHTSVALARAGRNARTDGYELAWFDLGSISEQRLQELEGTEPPAGHGGPSRFEALIWCLRFREQRSRLAAYRLGRFVAATAPGSVRVLVFPPAFPWAAVAPDASGSGSSPVLRRVGNPPARSARCLTWTRAAVDAGAVEMTVLEPEPEGAADNPAAPSEAESGPFEELSTQLVRAALARQTCLRAEGREP